jgi:hypothetical protein
MTYSKIIGFRATAGDEKKLKILAERTNRRMSDVLRLLIRQAVLADQPDIRLADGEGNGQKEVTK